MSQQPSTFRPNWVSPPGDTIAELLDEQGWSQAQFAERAGYSTKHVNQLIAGKAAITEDTAFRLERVLGSSAAFWLAREAQYREAVGRDAELASLEGGVGWLKEIPLAHMIKYKWVQKCDSKAEQVGECLRFFGVASLDVWRNTYGETVESCAAYRSSPKFEKKHGAVVAWLRQGERCAATIACEPFERAAFEKTLADLRVLTNEPNPQEFVGRLTAACAAVGVAVVLAPAPSGCPVHGATKWLTPTKALLMLSLRYKSNDHLWFAFFHEAAHILLHGKRMLFLETDGPIDDVQEREADRWAADLLIPPADALMLRYVSRTHAAVTEYAAKLGIAPGIVVGRMHHDKLMPPSYLQDLKVRYTWTE